MARFLADSKKGQAWVFQILGPVQLGSWILRNIGVRVRTPFPTSPTTPGRRFPLQKEVEEGVSWIDWYPHHIRLGGEEKGYLVWGWARERLGQAQVEREVLQYLKTRFVPILEQSLKFRSKRQVLEPLARKEQLGRGDLDWIALALLKPQIRLEGVKLSNLRVELFLGQDPWPKGVRPWDLAREKHPELWLYLA